LKQLKLIRVYALRLSSFIFFSLSLFRITLLESPFSLEQGQIHSFTWKITPKIGRVIKRNSLNLLKELKSSMAHFHGKVSFVNKGSLHKKENEEERCEAARREEERKKGQGFGFFFFFSPNYKRE